MCLVAAELLFYVDKVVEKFSVFGHWFICRTNMTKHNFSFLSFAIGWF